MTGIQREALFREPVPIGPDGEANDATAIAVAGGWRLAWFDGQHTSAPWGPLFPDVRDAIAGAQALNRRRRGE